MARSTVYNLITTDEKIEKINEDNKWLMSEFLDYLASVDRSPKTIVGYKNDLNIFFCWNMENNNNKEFVKINKREIAKFQNYALNEWKWSPKRIRRVKSTLSSLSNFIENILDEEEGFENFRSIIKKIESPANEAVREKTVLSNEQVEFLLDELVKRGEYEKSCAIAIAAFSGMRKAELLLMKMEYFTPEHIVFDCLYKTDKIRTKGRGRNGKLLNKYVMIKVDKYIDLWRKKREELGIDSEWVFVVKQGNEWIQRASLDTWTDEFSEILGEDFYFHSLRHYVCTNMASSNLPADIIREYFGWSDVGLIQVYNDSSAVDDFGKYFSADGVVKQDESKGFSDIK